MRAKLLCSTMGVLVSSTALVGGNAMAADLGMRAPPPLAPVAAPYSWSGIYVGAFGGVMAWEPTLWYGYAGFGDQSWDNAKGTGAFGGLAGGDVGINWQTGSFVYGLEGDFAGVFGGESSYIEELGGGDQYGWTAQTQAIGTIRGRAGLAFDRTLVYLTAGFAAIDVKNKFVDTGSSLAGSGTDWVPALALGGGVEYALTNNWSIKAEGLYLAAATSQTKHGGNSFRLYLYLQKHAITDHSQAGRELQVLASAETAQEDYLELQKPGREAGLLLRQRIVITTIQG